MFFLLIFFSSLLSMELDTPQNISDFIAQNYPNLEECCKNLKTAMDIRINTIKQLCNKYPNLDLSDCHENPESNPISEME